MSALIVEGNIADAERVRSGCFTKLTQAHEEKICKDDCFTKLTWAHQEEIGHCDGLLFD